MNGDERITSLSEIVMVWGLISKLIDHLASFEHRQEQAVLGKINQSMKKALRGDTNTARWL